MVSGSMSGSTGGGSCQLSGGGGGISPPFCGEAGQVGARGVIRTPSLPSPGGRAVTASRARAPFPAPRPVPVAAPAPLSPLAGARRLLAHSRGGLGRRPRVWGVSPPAPGLQGQVLLGHSGPTLSRTPMNSFLYVAAGPRAHVRAREYMCWWGSTRGRTSPAPRSWKHPLSGCAGAAWEVEALTERGAPAPGRSEAVYAEMGGSGGGRES